ncbi:uncharacterized protein LTR77_005865 [Saxophila tyrrhenica]|uniref:L-ornithine N(5)-monooxygenase [NAD(P)H] n=1 Tax=Saxophila tyrrhenica TaxID=1690608 RepID=A0AAV9PAB5_9PEZI|nr:hypothetical protein LTR77_005865 [Saxophila tyrrhenica]
MSPHAVFPDQMQSSTEPTSNGDTNGISQSSHLERWDDDELHDLLCVGFGPASLAIAVALHDAFEAKDCGLSTRRPKVRFLERQGRFAWHAGMLLPGTKMQITFIKDLATLRNPRSHFTFLNYLHQKNRLVQFTNLGTFLPERIEYEDYMRWCAEHFEEVVDYGQSVEAVGVDSRNARTGAVESFSVRSVDSKTGRRRTTRARHVVVAVGGKPSIPKELQANHPRVIHSSQYATSIEKIFPEGTQPRSIAVIGAGQSAAEIFHNIPQRFPECRSLLLIRGAALRPSDDSPFVNEIFDPNRVDDVYSQDPETRADGIASDKATNYGVVRLELLEELYTLLYSYRIRYSSEDQWPHQILNHRSVTGMNDAVDGQPGVQLHVRNNTGAHHADGKSRSEVLDVDLVVVASGYQRNAHEEMLQGIEQLRQQGKDGSSSWEVNRDYSIKFQDGVVERDAGIWLQGCNEGTHGLSDTLLSILATRGGEMVESIFGTG